MSTLSKEEIPVEEKVILTKEQEIDAKAEEMALKAFKKIPSVDPPKEKVEAKTEVKTEKGKGK